MTVPPERIRFTTYNVLDLFDGDTAASREHYELVAEAIRELRPDVLAVQEIRAPDEETARQRLCRLATDTGLNCLVPAAGGEPGGGSPDGGGTPGGGSPVGTAPAGGEPTPALGLGARGYHLGLLWRDGITAVPGSYRSRNRDFWHALAWVTLDVGGIRVRHAVYHAPPFGRKMRAQQNELLVAALARPDSRVPTLIGADWNCESADRVRARRGWRLYEPADPYAGADWFEDMVHQCGWDYGWRGRRRHWADRSAGEVLWAGGLHDAAAVLGAPWQPTTGHHPADPYGVRRISRRIDAVRVTAEVVPALRAHVVTGTSLTRRASDHLPVTVEYEPAAIRRPRPLARG